MPRASRVCPIHRRRAAAGLRVTAVADLAEAYKYEIRDVSATLACLHVLQIEVKVGKERVEKAVVLARAYDNVQCRAAVAHGHALKRHLGIDEKPMI